MLFISSCYLYVGTSIHDKDFDSEYKERHVLAHFGFEEEINDNLEVFIQHTSMPSYSESLRENDSGWGVNEVGIRVKVKLY